MKDDFMNDLDVDNYEMSYLAHSPYNHEVFICTPDSDSTTFPNKCLVYNYADNAFYRRDIRSETGYMAYGKDIEQLLSPTGDGVTREVNPIIMRLHALADDVIYKLDVGTQMNGANPTCRAERTDIPLGGINTLQTITAVYPEISGSAAINIYVGYQFHPGDTVTWSSAMSFDPSSDVKVDCLVTGALFAIAFESTDGTFWTLTGYTIEYEEAGLR